MNRKDFLQSSTLAIGGLIVPGQFQAKGNLNDPLSVRRVKEFVGAGHNDLHRVKEMLSEQPNLLYASYDWGNGDFETALEGAGHVGNREIAGHLIGEGARPNLFVLTMLGKTTLVKSFLEEVPSALRAYGPHGFTLLHHARVGGAPAAELFDYLREKGLESFKVDLQ